MIKWVIVSWLTSYTAFGQQEPVLVPDTAGCLSLSAMPMKRVWNGSYNVTDVDSVKMRASIDSAYQLAKGTWQLDQVRGGWAIPEKPSQEIRMEIDRQGKGMIYVGEELSTTLQISLSRLDNIFRFPIKQRGKDFFDHHCKTSYFLVCQRALVMREVMGDGTTFVFKRIR